MAIKYVNSGASGSNDGTSWTNAWVSLASSTGVSAGDFVYVHNAHSEDPGAAVTYNWSNGTVANPVKIFCVNKDSSDELSTGAAITQGTTGRKITIQGAIIVDGMSFTTTDDFALGTSSLPQIYRNCLFDMVTQTTSNNLGLAGAADFLFDACTIDLSDNASRTIAPASSTPGVARFRNCVIACGAGNTTAFTMGTRFRTHFDGCSFTGTSTNIVSATSSDAAGNATCVLKGCEVSSTTVTGTVGMTEVITLEQCANGAISDTPNTLTAHYTKQGTLTTDLTHYRSGGADDGAQANAYSWKVVTTASVLDGHIPFVTPPMVAWVAGGASKTFTVYIAGSADLEDDEIWMELEGPDSAATETAQYDCYSSRCGSRSTPAANGTYLKTSASDDTWTGTSTTAEQYITFTYTPAQAGPVKARICVAKPSTTVWIDPQIVIT